MKKSVSTYVNWIKMLYSTCTFHICNFTKMMNDCNFDTMMYIKYLNNLAAICYYFSSKWNIFSATVRGLGLSFRCWHREAAWSQLSCWFLFWGRWSSASRWVELESSSWRSVGTVASSFPLFCSSSSTSCVTHHYGCRFKSSKVHSRRESSHIQILGTAEPPDQHFPHFLFFWRCFSRIYIFFICSYPVWCEIF